mgnify:CR=1 FL=1
MRPASSSVHAPVRSRKLRLPGLIARQSLKRADLLRLTSGSTTRLSRAIARMTYTPVETWEVLAPALQRTGMTADEAALVMGGNMLRVAREVWR